MQCLTRFIVTPALVLMVALVSCGFPSISTVGSWPTNTGAVNTPVAYVVLQATATPISTLPATGAVPPKGKVHITTTSDWTNLRLVSGGTWVNPANMSSSSEATVASIKENLIILSQPMARAQAGKEVEITLDVLFSGLNPSGQVVLDIERGFIGSTRVEVFCI